MIFSLALAPASAQSGSGNAVSAPNPEITLDGIEQYYQQQISTSAKRDSAGKEFTQPAEDAETSPDTKSTRRLAAAYSYSDGLISQSGRIADVNVNSAPTAQQRITKIDITRDLVKRTVTAKATLAQTPTTANDSAVFVILGEWSGNTCNARVLLAAAAASSSTSGAFINASGAQTGNLTVKRSLKGAELTLTSAAHNTIRSAKWDCAYGFNRNASGDVMYTTFYAESLKDVFKPKFQIDPGAPVQGNLKGKYVKVRVQVRNSGKGDAKNVKVTASGKGLTIKKKTHSIKTLKNGRSEYLTFNVRVKSGKERKLKIKTTSSGGYTASKTVTIAVKPKPVTYKSLSDRYFWGYVPTTLSSYRGWESRTVWFLNSKWAYVGVPKNGAKPKCTKTTSTCKRYTYNSKTGVAKIGKQKFKVTSDGFEYRVKAKEKKAIFEPLTQPKKGAKLATKLINQDWVGNCMLTCTASTERIELGKNGKFLWTRSSVGSWPGLGSNWAIIPPDQRGTYKVISKGRIEFRYSDGSKKRFRIGVMRDVRGKDSPKGEGLVIGDTNFYRD
jgi:hypothetical protein